jgi:hypothetical protein
MDEKGSVTAKEVWVKPYVKACGHHSLSGPALAEVARAVLAPGCSFRFQALGASMNPLIRDGDVVTLVPFESAACAPGDVVGFIWPESGRLVVHRVISVAGDRCRIQGDNISTEDGTFPFGSIIGRVSQVERGGRSVRFGLGPERFLIALLSRRHLLPGCMRAARTVYSVVKRNS